LPTISIVTPCYNRGEFIEATIRSILLQGYPKLEYVIMDGGSTDSTLEIIRRYEPWLTYWVSEADGGQSAAINKGFQHTTGSLLNWVNSDDILLPGALAAVATLLCQLDSAVGAVVGIGHVVDQKGRVVYVPDPPELTFDAFLHWLEYGHFVQPACFFTRAAWVQHGPLNEALDYCMDVDLWLKMAGDYRFVKLDRLLAAATRHPTAKTTADRDQMIVELALLLTKYGRQDIARVHLMELANRHMLVKKRLRRLIANPFYRVAAGTWLFIKRLSARLTSEG
jgi:glycosyltransferase involved in cell wall biosynthesis